MIKVGPFDREFEGRTESVAIPHDMLSPEALRGVVESFVLREGTDYGIREFSLEQKISHVMAQIERGDARIVFDPNTDSIDIVEAKSVLLHERQNRE